MQEYRDIWEKKEEDSLRSDILLHMEMMERDRKYKDLHEAFDGQEMEAKSEQMIAAKEGLRSDDERTTDQ